MNPRVTERVLMVAIGAVCIFAVAGLINGWSAEDFLLIISFVVGTFFPSLVGRSLTTEKDE